jgi:hypothetical protein
MDDIKPGSIIYTNNPPVEIKGLMTLRDYFAAHAMQVVLKDQYENDMPIGEGYVDTGMNEEICAQVSYVMADAMLKARMEKNT